MIDIHSHILYDIEGDDGSRSRDMSLAMLQMAAASGTTDLCCTPHMHRRGVVPSWDSITERVASLQKDADAAHIPIHLYTGAEVSLDADTLNYLPAGSHDYCLAGTDYIMVELLSSSAPESTWRLLYELQMRGYLPIMVHPERYRTLMHHPEIFYDWVEKGILLQCNMGSFSGDFGEEAQKNVRWLYERGMIHFLGSDAHRTDWRSPDTTKAHAAIEKLSGGPEFWDACRDHARVILNHKIFYPDPPHKPIKKKKSLWQRLFG